MGRSEKVKVIINVKEKKGDPEHCTATITIQGLDKASEKEKIASSNVYNKVCEILQNELK